MAVLVAVTPLPLWCHTVFPAGPLGAAAALSAAGFFTACLLGVALRLEQHVQRVLAEIGLPPGGLFRAAGLGVSVLGAGSACIRSCICRSKAFALSPGHKRLRGRWHLPPALSASRGKRPATDAAMPSPG